MDSNHNIWDSLGKSSFNTHIGENQIDPRAADNMLLAWPPILDLIQSNYSPSKRIRVLDYGCGTGGFCTKLDLLGYSVVGIDSSEGMIETAINNSPSNIQYVLGNHTIVPSLGKFNIVVSIMTIQFIENAFEVMDHLNEAIVPGGLMILVDFNKTWVQESLRLRLWFENFDSIDSPTKGWKTFGEAKMPVYIREAKEYERIANRMGLSKILDVNPPFTNEFITKYPDYIPNNVSEYQIIGYRKK